jgi:DME family drug/metabolite transporter
MHSFFDRLMSSSIGYLYVTAAAALWASAGLAGAFAPEIPAPGLAAMRAFSGSAALCLFIGPKAIRALDFRSAWPAILAASVCLALFQWSFFVSVEIIGASMTSVVSTGMAPLAADGFGFFRRDDVPRRSLVLPGVISLIGLLVPIFNGTPTWGMAGAVVSGISYAAYAIAVARLEQTGRASGAGLAATAVAFAGAAIVLMPAVRPQIVSLVSVRALFIALYLGFATAALAYALFVRGLRYLTPSRALNAAFIQPIAAIVLARVVLDEPVDRLTIAAIAILGSSVLLRVCLPQMHENRNNFRR